MAAVHTRAPIVRAAGEGEQRWFYGGGLHTWKAGAEETGGAFLLFEDRMERGKVTPLHTHPSDETMYVLEGEVLVHMDGREHRVGAAEAGAAEIQQRPGAGLRDAGVLDGETRCPRGGHGPPGHRGAVTDR